MKGGAGRVNLEIFLKLRSKSLDLGFFFVAPPHVKKKMDHQANRMIRPQNLEISSRDEGWSTDQLHHGTCDDDGPVQFICGVMRHVVSLHAARSCKTPQ